MERGESMRFYASKTRCTRAGRGVDGDVLSFKSENVKLSLATIADLDACIGSSRKYTHVGTKQSSLSQLRVLLAERTGQRETGLMAVHDLHALFTLYINVRDCRM